MKTYYPACKFTGNFPETSKKIQAYMTQKHNARIAGCCRPSLPSLTQNDMAIYICHACAAFFAESSAARNITSIWEIIASDDTFVYPDHTGKSMTLQDCWRARGDVSQQNAVRKILNKMNIEIIELAQNRENSNFCGKFLYEELPEFCVKLAPNHFINNAEGLFIPHSEEEKDVLMRDHCKAIQTGSVVCYCGSCLRGLTAGGKTGIHLAELVFGS